MEFTFNVVNDPTVLLPILKERLPWSCFVYNEAVNYEGFKNVSKFYTLGRTHAKVPNSNSWIVYIWDRKDYGQTIDISIPLPIIRDEEKIPVEIRESFSSTDLIHWDGMVVFPGLERPVSTMIYNINVHEKGNVVQVHPHDLFYMDIEDALKSEIKHDSDIEVKRLSTKSDIDFIESNWHYKRDGTTDVLRMCVGGAASAGVYVSGTCVAGVVTIAGQLCALYTDSRYRKRGFGQLTMKYAYKELAKDGCVPCSTVEVRNVRSMKFHESLGAKRLSRVDWMEVKKIIID